MQGRAKTNVASKFNYPLFVFVLVIGFWGVVFFSCLIHMDGNTPCHGCSSRTVEHLCQEQMGSSAAAPAAGSACVPLLHTTCVQHQPLPTNQQV